MEGVEGVFIGFAIFHLVLIVIAIIRVITGKLKGSFLSYIEAIFRSISNTVGAWAGIYRTTMNSPMDWKYRELSDSIILDSVNFAHKKMILDKWTSDRYVLNRFDCDKFAHKLRIEMIAWLNDIIPSGELGWPIGVASYQKDIGGRHAVVIAINKDGHKMFFEPYPAIQNRTPCSLSGKELSTLHIEVM